jgi:hypothetical protein
VEAGRAPELDDLSYLLLKHIVGHDQSPDGGPQVSITSRDCLTHRNFNGIGFFHGLRLRHRLDSKVLFLFS